MRRLNARTTSKVTVRLQHPVPLTLLPEYLSSAVARFVAVRSIVIEYAALSFDEYDALHKACMEELFPGSRAAGENPVHSLDTPQVALRAPKRLTL